MKDRPDFCYFLVPLSIAVCEVVAGGAYHGGMLRLVVLGHKCLVHNSRMVLRPANGVVHPRQQDLQEPSGCLFIFVYFYKQRFQNCIVIILVVIILRKLANFFN